MESQGTTLGCKAREYLQSRGMKVCKYTKLIDNDQDPGRGKWRFALAIVLVPLLEIFDLHLGEISLPLSQTRS
jgi:hypothetical protein